jgi:hypothetical protein
MDISRILMSLSEKMQKSDVNDVKVALISPQLFQDLQSGQVRPRIERGSPNFKWKCGYHDTTSAGDV